MTKTTSKVHGHSSHSSSPIVRVMRARGETFLKKSQLCPTVPERIWDVSAMDRIAGVGRSLGKVRARTITEADTIAVAKFGKDILVSPAGAKPRRRRP